MHRVAWTREVEKWYILAEIHNTQEQKILYTILFSDLSPTI